MVVDLLKCKKSEQTLPDPVCLGDVEHARRLIKKGADVNATGPRFATLLMCAVRTGRVETAKMLLDNGADINAALDDGNTALRMAKEKGYKEIEDLLRGTGPKNRGKGIRLCNALADIDHMQTDFTFNYRFVTRAGFLASKKGKKIFRIGPVQIAVRRAPVL